MACDMSKDDVRALALRLKSVVNEAYTVFAPIHTKVNEWTLNDKDVYLPTVTSVKTQYTNYKNLTLLQVALTDVIKEIQQCDVELPDVVVIPFAGLTIPADGSFTF